MARLSNANHRTALLASLLCLAWLTGLTACSGGSQQEGDGASLENSGDNAADIPDDGSLQQGNNKGQGNQQGENFANGEGGQGEGNGQAVNNASDEDFVNNQGQGANSQGQGNFGAQNGGQSGGNNLLANDSGGEGINNALPSEDAIVDAPANGGNAPAPTNPVVEAPAVDNSVSPTVDSAAATEPVAPADGMPPAPAAAPQPARPPEPGGIVKYVQGSASLYDQAGSTNVVGTLNQGDHPLIWENGEWARTSDGKFIPNSALTTRPIGRKKSPIPWQ